MLYTFITPGLPHENWCPMIKIYDFIHRPPPSTSFEPFINLLIYLGGSPSVGVLLFIPPCCNGNLRTKHTGGLRAHTHKYVRDYPFFDYRKSYHVTNPRSPVTSKQNTRTLRDLYRILSTSKTKAEFDQEVT